VLALFAALTFEVLSLFHLGRASTVTEAQSWIDPIPGLPLVVLSSLLVALLSGIYLTIRLLAFGEACQKVTIAALFVVAPLAGALRAIRRMCATATEINSELHRRLQDPVLKVSLGIRIAVTLGIVFLMGAKPEMWKSVGIVGASIVLGLLSSLLNSRRASFPDPGVGRV
jgi:hypothetical protein